MRIFDTSRRCLRRTALPPRLVGLVTFSFALLGLGVVTYAASLPSLIQVAQRTEERGFADAFVEGLFGSGARCPLAWWDSSPFHSPCLAWASSPMPPHCRR